MRSSGKFYIVFMGGFFQRWRLDSRDRFMFLLALAKEMLSNAIHLIIEEYVLQERRLQFLVECEQLIHFGVSLQGDSLDEDLWSMLDLFLP